MTASPTDRDEDSASCEWVLVDGEACRAKIRNGSIASLSAPVKGPLDGLLWTGGFVDLHCHGALGFNFDDADDPGLHGAVGFHRQHGTRAVALSLVSAPIDALVSRVQMLRSALADLPIPARIHLEGPFLAKARRGAHAETALALPTRTSVQALLNACGDSLSHITIAPELPGAMEAIQEFAQSGVTVAIGHTEAEHQVAAEAFDRGASVLTHAFNGMPGLGHRDTGPIGAALERDHVVMELIADGFHVDPIVIRTLFAAAPGRVALVTDAMAAAGLGDGSYKLGSLDVDVVAGRPVLAKGGTLAGSTLTMSRAVKFAISCGVPPQDAIAAATVVPSRVLPARVSQPGVGTRLAELVPVDLGVRELASTGDR